MENVSDPRVSETTDYSPANSADAPVPSTGKKEKKNMTWLIICAAVLAVLIAAAFLWKPLLRMLAPKNYLSIATGNTINALAKRSEGSPYELLSHAGEIMDDGQLDLSLSCDDYYSGKTEASLSLKTKKKEKQLMLDAMISSNDQNLDLGVYLDADCVALQSDAFTAGNYYGLTFDTFARDIRSSYFNLILSEEEMQQYEQVVQQLHKSINSTVAYDELLEPYLEILKDFSEDQEPVISSERIELDGKTRKCDTFVYSIDQEQMNELFDALLTQLENDEDVSELFGDSAAIVQSIRTSMEARSVQSNQTCILTYYVYNLRLAAIGCEVTVSFNESENQSVNELMLTFGSNPKTSDLILEVKSEYKESKSCNTITSSIERSGSIYGNTITVDTVSNDECETLIISSSWNRDSGELDFSVSSDGEGENIEFGFTASLAEKDDGIELIIDDLGELYQNTGNELYQRTGTLSVRFTEGCTISKPQYTNFNKLGWSEIREFLLFFADDETNAILSDTRNRLRCESFLLLPEKYELENRIETAMRSSNCDIAVHVIERVDGETIDTVADRLSEDFTLSEHYTKGVVIVLCPETKEWAIRGQGKVSQHFCSSFTDLFNMRYEEFMKDGSIMAGVSQLLNNLSWV